MGIYILNTISLTNLQKSHEWHDTIVKNYINVTTTNHWTEHTGKTLETHFESRSESYISLWIIFCIIEYVMNKKPWNLEKDQRRRRSHCDWHHLQQSFSNVPIWDCEIIGNFFRKILFQSLYLKRSTYLWNVLAISEWKMFQGKSYIVLFSVEALKYIFLHKQKKQTKTL